MSALYRAKKNHFKAGFFIVERIPFLGHGEVIMDKQKRLISYKSIFIFI